MKYASGWRRWTRSTRVFPVALVVVLLVGLTSSSTSGARDDKPDNKDPYEFAQTQTVIAPPDGQPVEVRWPKVAGLRLRSRCVAGWNEDSHRYTVGMFGLTAFNTGQTPVLFAGEAPVYEWLAPGEGDAFVVVGEVVNESMPDGSGEVFPFALLNEGGRSVTGLFAYSATMDADNNGHCTFTLQMKG